MGKTQGLRFIATVMLIVALAMLLLPMSETYDAGFRDGDRTTRCGSVVNPYEYYPRTTLTSRDRDGCWAKRNNRLIAVLVLAGLGVCCLYGGQVALKGERDAEPSA